jgi:hypothetical protein
MEQSRVCCKKMAHNETKPWYMDNLKPLFTASSPYSSRNLWDAIYPLSYSGAPGDGFKHTEVSKKHVIGLMQSLDLLAIAKGERQLPQDIDFAGNLLDSMVPKI